MATSSAQRTYSFRAPHEFATRMQSARAGLQDILADSAQADHFSHEFEIALYRRLRDLPETPGQTEFARAVTEALVATVERVQRESELMEQMSAFKREDVEGDAWRRGALLSRARAGHFDD